jgi:hypothetical protein
LDFGDETISARYHGPAHTRGDVVTLLEKANLYPVSTCRPAAATACRPTSAWPMDELTDS